jgi:bacterioferritin
MRQMPTTEAQVKPLAQQKTDFTAEGSPPPGRVSGAALHPGAMTPGLNKAARSGKTQHTRMDAHEVDLPDPQQQLFLNKALMQAAANDLDQGAITPHYGPWGEEVVKLLNDALATELVCVLRYKRHHFTATGLASARIAEEFLVHAMEETAHADRLARRIVQLGGEPDFAPETLLARSHVPYEAPLDLTAMIKSNLTAERVAIESYSQMIDLIAEKDPTTRRLLEDILGEEQAHAEELKGWLTA